MTREWRVATVADLQQQGILLVEDGNHGEYRPRPDEFVGAGTAFIRAADMDGGRVLFESASKINERARRRITKGIGARGDVLLSHKGTVGKVALVGEDAPSFVCSPQTTFWRTLDLDVLDRGYLYAFLRSAGFQQQLATRAGETDMAPYVSLTSQRSLSVTLPPIGIQRAIARILGALDDKIELNRRMNETLDAMARAIFKSWFVDFDPVHATAEGRDPGLPRYLSALFPNSVVQSQLGAIPTGWKVVPLEAVCTRITDGAHSSPESVDVGYPMASVKDMHDWGFDLSTCRHIAENDYRELVRNDCRPLARDVLIAKDGSYLKHIFVVERDLDLVILSSIAILRPNDQIDSHILAFSLRSDPTMARMEQYVSGAVLQRIVLKDFRKFPILVPPQELQQAWVHICGPLVRRCWHNVTENEVLAALRDTLLPKLISGELRVKDAERMVEKVA